MYRLTRLSVPVLALALAACGGDAPASPAGGEGGANEPVAIEEELPVVGEQRHVLAFGDSLFAGYNVAANQSYPAKLEAALRARGKNVRVINAGVSGDTTAAGAQRIRFTLQNLEEVPDLAIVELGGNDLLRGIDPAQTRANMRQILVELKSRNIPVLLMGMRAPPNLGVSFLGDFDPIYPDLAGEFDADLVPFFLEAVYDRPELIQPDRVHPTVEGIEELVAATVGAVDEALPEQ